MSNYKFSALYIFLAFLPLHAAQQNDLSIPSKDTQTPYANPYPMQDETEMKEGGIDDQCLNDSDDQAAIAHAFDSPAPPRVLSISNSTPDKPMPFRDSKQPFQVDSSVISAHEINEQLISIHQMPPCIEKYAKKLSLYLSLISSLKKNGPTKKELEVKIKETIEAFRDICTKQAILTKVKAIESSFLANPQGCLDKAYALQKAIEPFDLEHAFRLIKKNYSAKQQMTDKHVILFVGPTGAGKSTSILALLNIPMEKVVTFDGFTTIRPKADAIPKKYKPYLGGIKPSPRSQSETSHASGVPVILSDMDIFYKNIDEVLLVDTAGFFDIEGPERDLANGIGMIEAIKAAKAVKIVVVIPYSDVNLRFRQCIPLLRTLAGIIKNLEDHTSSTSYLFTNVPQEDNNNIQAMINDKLKTGSSELNDTIQSVLADMLKKHKKEQTIVLDPLGGEDEMDEAWQKLVNKKTSFITNPADVFSTFVAEESNHDLRLQLQMLTASIRESILANNFKLLRYRLDQLQRLATLFPDRQDIQSDLTESTKYVCGKWNAHYEEAFKKIQEELQEGSALKKNTLTKYKLLRCLMKSPSGQAIAKLITYTQKDKEPISHTAAQEKLVHVVEKFTADLAKKPFSDPALGGQLQKLNLIDSEFSSFRMLAKKLKAQFLEKIADTVSGAQDKVNTRTFDLFLRDYAVLRGALALEPLLRKDILLSKILESLVSDTTNVFATSAKKCIRCFSGAPDQKISYLETSGTEGNHASAPVTLNDHDIIQVNETLKLLEEGIRCFANQTYFDLLYQQVTTYKQDILHAVDDYIRGSQQVIHQLSKANHDPALLRKVKGIYQNIAKIREIKTVGENTENAYYRLRLAVEKHFEEIGKKMGAIEKKIFAGACSAQEIKELVQLTQWLRNASWFDTAQEESTTTTTLLESFSNELEFSLQQWMDIVECIHLSLDKPQQSKELFRLYEVLTSMQPLCAILPAIRPTIATIKQNIGKKIKAICHEINTTFNVEKISLQSQVALKDHLVDMQGAHEIGKRAAQYLRKNGIKSLAAAKSEMHQLREKRDNIEQEISTVEKGKNASVQKQKDAYLKLVEIEGEYNKIVNKMNLMGKIRSYTGFSQNAEALQYLKKARYSSIEAVKEKREKIEKELREAEKKFAAENKDILAKEKRIVQAMENLQVKIDHYNTLEKERKEVITATVSALEKKGCRPSDILKWRQSPKDVERKIHALTQTITQFKKNNLRYQFDPNSHKKIQATCNYLDICNQTFSNDQLKIFAQPQ